MKINTQQNRVRIQWAPNVIAHQKRICLTRIRWEMGGPVGVFQGGSSNKLSISVCFVPADLWFGLFVKRLGPYRGWSAFICVVPCIPIRIKLVRSWGGIFP